MSISVNVNCYDQDASYDQTETFSIKKSDYNGNGYYRARVQPQYPRALGLSVQYESDDFALVQEINMMYENETNAVIKQGLSK
jgi:hypothetical protein